MTFTRHALPYATATLCIALLSACAAEITDPTQDFESAPSSEELTSTRTFTGTMNSATKSWVSHKMDISGPTDITATLAWNNTAADLNLYLYVDGGSKPVAYSNKAKRPEVVTVKGVVGKQVSFGIKSRSGGSSPYTLTVTTSTPEVAPPPPVDPTCNYKSFPGKPAAGTIFWGSSIGGNSDPVARHEAPSGKVLSIRRTFFAWDKRATSMVTMAKGDIAAGRLPWVSTKTPPWADMASGKHDAEIDSMLKALDALPGPVWLTIHHEPEGGGGVPTPDDVAGPAGHLAMNRRVRARMTALNTDNIALAPILMSWTWDSRSGRNPNEWYGEGVYDFLGIDHYRESEASIVTSVWYDVRQWAEEHCIEIGVGEWGVRGSSAAAGNYMLEWYNHAANSRTDGAGAPVIALSAFDSSLNSPSGSWELVGAQLTMFHTLLGDARTAHITK